MKPSRAPASASYEPAAPAGSTPPPAQSSDAAHAAAIFGGARRAAAPARKAVEDEEAVDPNAPLWRTLRVGSECLASLDGRWCHVKVVGTVHAGFANARFKVVAATGDDAPRELGAASLRPATEDAARLARGRCTFFDAGTCVRGERCPWAHLPSDGT
jgi:hypothetical protein